jgi:hypothetical protein
MSSATSQDELAKKVAALTIINKALQSENEQVRSQQRALCRSCAAHALRPRCSCVVKWRTRATRTWRCAAAALWLSAAHS